MLMKFDWAVLIEMSLDDHFSYEMTGKSARRCWLITNQPSEQFDIFVVSIYHKRRQVINDYWYITPPAPPDDDHNHPDWLFYIRECTYYYYPVFSEDYNYIYSINHYHKSPY